MTTLILAHGRLFSGPPRCLPVGAKGLEISMADAIMIDNEPSVQPDILYDLESGEALPFEQGTVESIIDTGGLGGLHGWFTMPRFWKEMSRILKPGGVFHGDHRNRPLHSLKFDSDDFECCVLQSTESAHKSFRLTRKPILITKLEPPQISSCHDKK